MHAIEVIIAKEEITKDIESRFVCAKSVSLTQGFAIVPLTDELKDDLDELIGKEQLSYECFEKLSSSVCELITDTQIQYKIAYIETEYFGGEGNQVAIVWENGKVIYGPESTDSCKGAINRALRELGVRVVKQQDEFDEMKLGFKRSSDDWFNSDS